MSRFVLHLHHALNAVLAVSFLACKYTPVVCEQVFHEPDPCELNDHECKLMFFAAFVIWAKTKKTGSRTMGAYFSTIYTYLKLLNLILWFYAGPVKGIIYLVLALVTLLWFPEPASDIQEKVTYYSHQVLEEALSTHRNTTFFICFFATWLPSSVQFAKVFSQLSATYALDNLVFGKVDVTRHPESAERHRISASSFSRQLPTVALFQHGAEVTRRPGLDASGRLIPFLFKQDNVVAAFDLNNVHQKCKEELPRFNKIEAKKDK